VRGTLGRIRQLVAIGRSRVSDHGFRELREDGIKLGKVLAGLADATVVEDYPDYHKGPSVLVRQFDGKDRPLHVLWGIAKIGEPVATLVTAYRPDPSVWSPDFLRRLPK